MGAPYFTTMSALSARRSDRSTKAALRRVLASRLRAGLDEIAAQGEGASLHELRKRTKELRGLLRMLRTGLPEFPRMNGQLRDAAAGLSPARDAEVMLSRFDGITAGLRDPSSFSGLRACILSEIDTRRATANANALPDYAQVLSELEPDLAKLKLSDKASRVIWAGLHDTWARARKRHGQAQTAYDTDFKAQPFHDWRKSVKHHWYQARFLSKIAPRKMAKHIAQIDTLGEVLGDHNDLDVMIVFLKTRDGLSEADRNARDIFIRHAMTHRRALARRALVLGQDVLEPPPDTLVGQWQTWWARWREA